MLSRKRPLALGGISKLQKPVQLLFWLTLALLCTLTHDSVAAPRPQDSINAQSGDKSPVWYSHTADGKLKVHLYFFWSKKCPHCQEALPFMQQLPTRYDWLQLHSLELTEHPDHVEQYIRMAAMLGQEARSVPAFMWCAQMSVGYDNEQGVGAFLLHQLQTCQQQLTTHNTLATDKRRPSFVEPGISLPVLGQLDAQRFSLPVFTLILAGLDAFNPCAFFVLLFLLSLLVHAKNRTKMLLIGGIFVFFSGLLYFLFMAAWLNMFLLIGQINAITYIAGTVAVIFALINIKDYFWFKQGVSLSIPDSAKSSLFARMRKLVNSQNTTAMVLAAIGLAVFANLYEFLCTAGFPMVFARILTLNDLSSTAYYLYLVFYNVIYIVPLLLIVIVFSLTLGTRKLQERQGRILKLMSGMMMLGLGVILLLEPNWLNNVGVAVLLLTVALLITYFVTLIEGRRPGRSSSP
ncbi:MAG: thioredoxin family protein [Gammaproteobacteria bacterium]|nr:thioredoxin family protein [Gammaproteobacteria bacterium]